MKFTKSLQLSPLALAHRAQFEQAVKETDWASRSYLAALSFPVHFLWTNLQEYRWATLGGWFCLFARYADGVYMPIPPLGPCPALCATHEIITFHDVTQHAFAWMDEHNRGSAVTRIEHVPEELQDDLAQAGWRLTPSFSDYLYETRILADLRGDRFKAQRAAINQLLRKHQVRYAVYSNDQHEACLALLDRWLEQKQQRQAGTMLDQDRLSAYLLEDAVSAHHLAFARHKELDLIGRVVWVDQAVAAYTFACVRGPDLLCVMLEVADRTIPGVAPFIFRELCREMSEVRFVNTMDDSGLESLAQSKRHYHPCKLVPSFIATKHAGKD